VHGNPVPVWKISLTALVILPDRALTPDTTVINMEILETSQDFKYSFKTKNLYLLLLSLQVFDMINFMIVSELVKKRLIDIDLGVQIAIQFTVVLITNTIITVFVHRFLKNKLLFSVYLLAMILSLIFSFGTEGPLKSIMTMEQVKVLRLLGFGFALISNIFIAMLALKDIFSKKHELSYSLIGASSIFLLFGIIFALLYMLLEVWSPGLIVKSENSNIIHPCLQYSFYVISGQDPPFENVDLVVRNVSTFESIFSYLYGLMVVGRLLTK